MGRALTHIALHVRDIEASKRFYTEWGGMKECSPVSGQKSPWLSSPGQEGHFALVLVPGATQPYQQAGDNFTRMGIAVESKEALEELYERAKREKILHRDYRESRDGQRASFSVRDPDGNIVEFWKGRQPRLTRKFNNFSLHVRDIDVSRDFYVQWCNFKVKAKGADGHCWRLVSPESEDAFTLILVDGGSHPQSQPDGDISHIGIAVETEDELKDLYEKAEKAGIKSLDLRKLPPPAGTLFFVKDPDGRNVEFSTGQPLGDFQNRKPEIGGLDYVG